MTLAATRDRRRARRRTAPGRGARLVATAALLVTIAALVGACRRDARKVRVVPLAGESVVLPREAAPPPPPPGTRESRRTVEAAGRTRTFLVYPPPRVEPGHRYPLVLVFHGDGGNAAGFHAAWPFERLSGADAYVVYLDGRSATWDLETLTGNADIAFVEAVVKELEAELPLDPARRFATGYSSGGFFSNVLACQRPGFLRAIASNAGGAPYNQATTWPNGYPKCPGQEPVAMLALHGEQDYGVTIDSGRFSAEYWAYVNGCTADEREPTGWPECQAYRGCKPGKNVAFCAIGPLGHWVWDHAAEATWTFFSRQ